MNTFWNDQTFWATPIVYDALDVYGLPDQGAVVKVQFMDPDPSHRPTALASATWVNPPTLDLPGWYQGPIDRVHGHGLIVVNKYWWHKLTTDERREVLGHEAAHIIDLWLHGRLGDPHGARWRAIMVELGLPPHATYQGPATRILECPTTR